jgi:hypothetical protein
MIVRIDNVGGKTHVYVARQATAGASTAATKKTAAAGRLEVKEVTESEVRKPR